MTKARMLEIKAELKSEAKELRDTKIEMRQGMSQGKTCEAAVLQSKLSGMKYHWRHKHIAYCLLRGRTIEEIEPRCSEDNLRNDALVEKYKKDFGDEQQP